MPFDMAFLKEKVGPVPVYVIVIGGGVGVAALVWRARAQSKPTPAPYDISTQEDTPFAPGIQPGGGGNVPINNGAIVSGGGSSNISTNNDWNRYALSILIGMGYDPVVASGALTNYLSGETLSGQESAMVQVALSKAGPPPTPAPAPNVAPPTVVPVGGGPSSGGAVAAPWTPPNDPSRGVGVAFGNFGTDTVKPGDTYGSMARKWYGDESYWVGIWAANYVHGAGFSSPGEHPPVGTVLWIPSPGSRTSDPWPGAGT
jgi:hypothetical protein